MDVGMGGGGDKASNVCADQEVGGAAVGEYHWHESGREGGMDVSFD